MRKILLFILISLLLPVSANANDIAKYVNKTNFDDANIYVVNKNTNEVIYKQNENSPKNPASLLKPITFKVAYDVLGKDYQFKTSLYLDDNKNAYIKLGGDVLLTQDNLKTLSAKLKNIEINNIYIDDTIFDKEPYPSTWLDEDKWPRQREITPYVIDRNYTQIGIVRSSLAKKVDVVQNGEYKIPIINELQIGDIHKINIVQPYGQNSPIISLQGSVEHDAVINIPVLNPEINFNVKLSEALDKNKILYNKTITSKKVPDNAKEIATIEHSLQSVSKLILHNSDNFASEIVSKVAASKYFEKNNVSFEDTINMVYEKYCNLGEDEKIADMSGVSRQNFLSVKTINDIYQEIIKDEEYKKLFQTSNQGSMSDRLLFLKGNLKVKTGTMRQLSALSGTLITRNNNEILFTTIIQDATRRKALLKNFENSLIGIIYKYY